MKSKSASYGVGVIMAGGLGERFWPKTNEKTPKYAISFNGKDTLLGATYKRLQKIFSNKNIYVITIPEHKALIKKLLPKISKTQILTEPMRRNTAGAISLATALIAKEYGKEVVVSFFPADAQIKKTSLFAKLMKQNILFAKESNAITTLGIKPHYPATGYGYIQYQKLLSQSKLNQYKVKQFIEKPSLAKAKNLIKRGRVLWNAGIFSWKIKTFENAITKHAPTYKKIFDFVQHQKSFSLNNIKPVYSKLKNESIDVALMEKVGVVSVNPADIGWDDIGSWEALRRMNQDRKGNVIVSNAIVESTSDSVIHLDKTRKAIVVGIKDLVIVEDGGVLLVCDRKNAEEVKKMRKTFLSYFGSKVS